MKVVIIKYNAGNVQSVRYALQRLGVEPIITDNPDEIHGAEKVIFPGVGNAASAMQYLKDRQLDKLIRSLKQPVLGICLGLQLLCSHTEEGDTPCLNIFDTKVKLFKEDNISNLNASEMVIGAPPLHKVPQVGWNDLYELNSTLFNKVNEHTFVYYVHSYYAELSTNTIAKTRFMLPYSAALKKDNFYAVQFHPEKSGEKGQQMIQNFLSL